MAEVHSTGLADGDIKALLEKMHSQNAAAHAKTLRRFEETNQRFDTRFEETNQRMDASLRKCAGIST
jgi:hypothetical protein